MKTDDLIQNLTLDLKPKQSMGSPLRSISFFTFLGIFILGLSLCMMTCRTDLKEIIYHPKFLFDLILSFILSVVTLSLAVFLSRPGFEIAVKKLKYMTICFLVVSLVSSGLNVAQLSQSQINLGLSTSGVECFFIVLGYAVVLGAALFFQLRKAASLDSDLSGLVIGATCVSLGNVGICFFCGIDNGVHIVLWHFAIPMVVALASGIGLSRLLLKW